MSCEQYREIISAAMDGEADEEELTALRAHLEICPECRAYQEALSELSELLAADLPEPGPSFTESVMDAVREAEQSKKVIRLRARRRYATLAASLLVVAGLGLAAAQGRGKAAPETPMMMAAAPAEAAMWEADAEEEIVYANEYGDNAVNNFSMNPAAGLEENGVSKYATDSEEAAPMMTMMAPAAEPEAAEAPAPVLGMAAPAAGTETADNSAWANALPDYPGIVREYLLAALPEAVTDLDETEPEIFSLGDEELPACEFCTEGYVPVGSVTAVRFLSPSIRCTLTVFVDETGTVFGTARE